MTGQAVNVASLDDIITHQRAAFHAEGPPTADIRRDRLSRVIDLMVEHRDAFADALSADFGHRSRDLSLMRAASDRLTPVTLELGGKPPAIVSDDIDLVLASERIMVGKIANAGQICIAPDHVYVPRGREMAFVEAATAAVCRMLPDGLGSPDYTAMISDRHMQSVQSLLEDAQNAGSKVLSVFGSSMTKERRFDPAFILNPKAASALMADEIFGPVLRVIGYDDPAAVIEDIRSRPRPLALYYFGQDDERARRYLDAIVSGGTVINDVLIHNGDEQLPFGGIGASGMGAYHGVHGFRRFSHARAVYMQSSSSEVTPVMQPPYDGRGDAMLDQLISA